MRHYEKPILTFYELFEDDVVTASTGVEACDDVGGWQQGWEDVLGGEQ